mgnify:CR=1 FL=1
MALEQLESRLAGLDAKVAHPLTGPVAVRGARPGDLLEVEYLDIVPVRASKGAAVRFFAAHRDVPLDRILVAG